MEGSGWCVLKYSGDADGYRVTALQSPVCRLFANKIQRRGWKDDEDHREEHLSRVIK